MKLYVASAFGNLLEARAIMEVLRAVGHEITCDWTTEQLDTNWPKEKQEAYLQECGARDYQGVMGAGAVILLNHKDCRDSMTEFGLALGAKIPALVLYPHRRASVFFHRATPIASIGELIDTLARFAAFGPAVSVARE